MFVYISLVLVVYQFVTSEAAAMARKVASLPKIPQESRKKVTLQELF